MVSTILIYLFILIAGVISLRLSYKLQIENEKLRKEIEYLENLNSGLFEKIDNNLKLFEAQNNKK
jgi:hypothetical protein